jgi:hypothetical protein
MPWVVRLFFLLLEPVATNWLVLASSSGITPKAGADGPENAENPGSAAVPENANTVDDALRSPPQPAPEKNVLFEAVTSLEEQLTALHAALPPRTAFLLFSGHSDPRRMSALAARRAEFQASQNQSQKENGGTPVAAYAGTTTCGGGGSASAVRWNTADDRALEEAVMRARMGLLFIGVKG